MIHIWISAKREMLLLKYSAAFKFAADGHCRFAEVKLRGHDHALLYLGTAHFVCTTRSEMTLPLSLLVLETVEERPYQRLDAFDTNADNHVDIRAVSATASSMPPPHGERAQRHRHRRPRLERLDEPGRRSW